MMNKKAWVGYKMDYTYMGKQIRHYRRARGMSQTALAEALGLSAAHVGHIERGSRHASLETVVAISRQLEVSLDVLIFSRAASTSNDDQRIHQLRQLLHSAGELIDDLATSAAD